MDLMQLMQNRRSVREYTGDKIESGSLKKILQAGLLAPSGRGSRPWEFIVVRDKKILQRMSQCRIGAAEMLAEADCAIVVLGDGDVTDIWVEDCAIAMTNMHLMADSLGVGSCWVQGRLRTDASGRSTESYLRNLLDFPKRYRLEAVLALGMPYNHPEAYELDELPWEKVHYEKFQNDINAD